MVDNKWNIYDYLRTLPAIIFAGIIFYVSSLSNPFPLGPPGPLTFLEINMNSILHICVFGILSFLVAYGFVNKVKHAYLIAITILYSFLDEVHQYFVPNRYFEIFDFIFNSIGVILGFLSYLLIIKLRIYLTKEELNKNKDLT